jgi:hypothetical protein
MRRRMTRLIQYSWIFVIVFLCVGLVAPVKAAPGQRRVARLDAKIYLTRDTLQQRFQASLAQQLPKLKQSAINGLTGSLPGWAGQFANSLIDPSVSLTALTPQQGGLRADFTVSLYQGDPQPINLSMLVTFQIANSHTIQINGQTLPGQPLLISGPLTTIAFPIGQLTSIQVTPNCGNANLQIGLQLPIDLTPRAISQTVNNTILATLPATSRTPQYASLSTQISIQAHRSQSVQDALPASVEVPGSSIEALAASIGTISINQSLQAHNLRLSVQNGQYVATADIVGNVFSNPTLKLGTASTTIIPEAVNGQFQMHVQNTSVHNLLLTLPVDLYNQKIEQALNTKVAGVLNGRVTISSVGVGPTAQIPCAAPDSLVVSGSAMIPNA